MESKGGTQFSVERQADDVLMRGRSGVFFTRENARALGQALIAAAGQELQRYRDCDGDIWQSDEQGLFSLVVSGGVDVSEDPVVKGWSLDRLGNVFGPLTPLPVEQEQQEEDVEEQPASDTTRYRDSDGDIWERNEQGLFKLAEYSNGVRARVTTLNGLSLAYIDNQYGPLTPLSEGQEQENSEAPRYRDHGGDIWERNEQGVYTLIRYSDGSPADDDGFADWSLSSLDNSFGPLTPLESKPDLTDVLERLSRGLTDEASTESGSVAEALYCVRNQLDFLVAQLREQQ
jgi:hypothetical protein